MQYNNAILLKVYGGDEKKYVVAEFYSKAMEEYTYCASAYVQLAVEEHAKILLQAYVQYVPSERRSLFRKMYKPFLQQEVCFDNV